MRYTGFVLCGIAVLVTSSCRLATDTPVATAPVTPVDTSRSGVHRSGRWEYQYTVSLAGTKSEGYYGKLLFDGKLVPAAAGLNDYYQTPWGKLYWVDQRMVPFGGHGWMLKARPSSPAGKQLPDPAATAAAAAAERPAIMAQVLAKGEAHDGDGPKIEEWVRAELKKLDVTQVRVERDWFPLTDQAVTIHDTKMLGRLTVRLADPRDENTLTVILDGTRAVKVQLPRRDGATRLVRHTLSSAVSEASFYIALRVDRAAPGASKAQEIGPGADGQTVRVKGVSRVIIKLPGNRNSGFAWEVTSVDGRAVQVDGGVQYVPDAMEEDYRPGADDLDDLARALEVRDVLPEIAGGIYEAAFRVVGKGQATVKMAYRRSWQAETPPEKTFRVTLDVQDGPVSAAAESAEEKR